MSLIHRQPTPAQSQASRENSLASTGPRTEQGKAQSCRNGCPGPRKHSLLEALNVQALGEDPDDFERIRRELTAAMRPRDAWEQAWTEDIAALRWRLWRLQRAEAGTLAAQRQQRAAQRQRQALPAAGLEDVAMRLQVQAAGFTGLPDSPWKFQQVLTFLNQLRMLIQHSCLEGDGVVYFDVIYGKHPGPLGASLRGRFQALSQQFESGEFKEGQASQVELLAAVDGEIAHYRKRESLYAAEHQEDDPVREDVDMLLPSKAMDQVIRYEAHLESQIERKLRQFYARRRESSLPPAEAPPGLPEKAPGKEEALSALGA